VHAESVWLPSALCGRDTQWSSSDASHLIAYRTLRGEPTSLELTVDGSGRLETVRLSRWANPDGKGFRYLPFGGEASDERTFGGYTIPTQLRIGYYLGTQRFESDGEFFRVTVDDAMYR